MLPLLLALLPHPTSSFWHQTSSDCWSCHGVNKASWAKTTQQQHQQQPSCRSHVVLASAAAAKGEDEENDKGLAFVDNNDRRRCALELLKTELGASDAQMKKIVKRADSTPSSTFLILPNDTLLQRIEFFRNKDGPFGFSNAELQKIVVPQPTILAFRTSTLESKMMHSLPDLLDLRDKKDGKKVLRKMVMVSPLILSCSDKNIQSKMNNLLSLFGGDKNTVRKLVTNNPTLLSLKTETVNARFHRLLDFWDGDEKVARKAMCKPPCLLLLSEENFMSKVQNIANFVGGDKNAVQKVVKRSPSIFGLSKDTACSKVENLRNFVGKKHEEAVRRTVVWCPSAVFGLSEDSLNVKLLFLTDNIFGGNVDATRCFITSCPLVLNKGTDSLAAKAAYLTEAVYNGNQKSFIKSVLKWPVVLGALSLENRIKPRVGAVRAVGLDPATLNVGTMMKLTDAAFDVWLENRCLEQQGGVK